MKIYRATSLLKFVLFFFFPSVILFAQSPVHVDFSNDKVGPLPAGWDSKEMDKARHVYSIKSEEGKSYLHADARNVSVQIGREVGWDLGEFPILKWQWRANRFPDLSNERTKDGNDSVLGLYIVFGKWPFPRTIKYIWSDTLPLGETFDSPFSSRTKMVVLRTGRSLGGTWVTEERDVLADYRRLFSGTEPGPIVRGIGILTDSDGTRSHAIGSYGDLQTLKTPS